MTMTYLPETLVQSKVMPEKTLLISKDYLSQFDNPPFLQNYLKAILWITKPWVMFIKMKRLMS